MDQNNAHEVVAYCPDQEAQALVPYNGYTVRVGSRTGVLQVATAVPQGVGHQRKVTVDFCSCSPSYGPASDDCQKRIEQVFGCPVG